MKTLPRSLSAAALVLLALGGCESMSENPIAPSDDRYNRTIEVVNATDRLITHIRARNVDTGVWIADVLGGNRLRAGQSKTVQFDDGTGACIFTLRTSYMRGYNRVTDRTYNVCEFTTLTYE